MFCHDVLPSVTRPACATVFRQFAKISQLTKAIKRK
jgi:hypothetical protein